jgi:hypothetical protein
MLAGSWVLLALSGPMATQGYGAAPERDAFSFIPRMRRPAGVGGLLNLAAVAGLPPLYQGLMGSAVAWLVWGIIRFFRVARGSERGFRPHQIDHEPARLGHANKTTAVTNVQIRTMFKDLNGTVTTPC